MRLLNEFVVEKISYQYTIKCFCGEVWKWSTPVEGRSARYIADMASDEGWTLDEVLGPRCTVCLRKKRNGLLPKDPSNLGKVQTGVLQSLRKFGSWTNLGIGSGWVWDSPSNTKKVLNSLVKRGLVTVRLGIYQPVYAGPPSDDYCDDGQPGAWHLKGDPECDTCG